MPCSDSSSSIALKLDASERFIAFDYAKITCGREITGKTGLQEYFRGMMLDDILTIPFKTLQSKIPHEDEETRFIMYLEWDALRAAIAQYLGVDDQDLDKDRCVISAVEHSAEGVEVAMVILPPKELPKIMACGISDQLIQEGKE